MSKQKTAERDSNIEVLRIISIFLIVIGHMTSQSGILDALEYNTHIIVLFISSALRIAVNVFLIIGVWFMVDSKFRSQRIIKLYSELFLYSVSITLVMLIGGGYTTHQGCI